MPPPGHPVPRLCGRITAPTNNRPLPFSLYLFLSISFLHFPSGIPRRENVLFGKNLGKPLVRRLIMKHNQTIRSVRLAYLLVSAGVCLLGVVLIAAPEISARVLCRLGGGDPLGDSGLCAAVPALGKRSGAYRAAGGIPGSRGCPEPDHRAHRRAQNPKDLPGDHRQRLRKL